MSIKKLITMSEHMGAAIVEGSAIYECTETSFIRQAITAYLQTIEDPSIQAHLAKHKEFMLSGSFAPGRKPGSRNQMPDEEPKPEARTSHMCDDEGNSLE